MRAIMLSVVALYHFAPLPDPRAVRDPLFAFCEEREVKGTLLLAEEGINGTIAGSKVSLDQVIAHIRAWPGFATMDVKYSHADAMPFGRLKVKVKREIVTMGVEGIDPRSDAGHYVAATDWNALIADSDTIVIDTRNDFEVEAGTFEGALNPQTASFRQFPAWFDAEAERLRAEGRVPKFAMFCTGGIRCEKATAYVRSKGFDQVYHLQGGILKYLEEVPVAQSKWHGSCFVFDEREGLIEGLEIRRG
ncbi:MAG: rhodanese-related sulfurtransferase [Sphingorhabdus sp.]